MRVAVHKTVTRSPAVRPAAAAHVLQPASNMSRAADPAEREAESMARNVVRMPLPASAVSRLKTNLRSDAGEPLPPGVLSFMEARFRTNLSAVRVHSGPQAAQLNRQINARAFTVGQHIYFGEGRFRPETPEGLELIAHEVTHTVQQQGGAARVQRLGLDDVVDGLAALAANVPGFTLLTLIIGRNPINLRAVERSAANLLRGFMGLIPGGELFFRVLERYAVVTRLGNWIASQTENLGLNFEAIRNAFTAFIESLGWRDIFSPGDVWRRAQDIFVPPLRRLRDLASRLALQAIAWLKEALMQPLADFCRAVPGYALVTVQLGRDPFTNAPVARTALNVARAVAEFIPSGREKVDQLAQSGALERAYRWFMDETRARNLTWERISGTFREAWNSLSPEDALHPIDTLRRMVSLLRPLLSDLAGFARGALMKLAEFIFEAAMGAGGARIVAIFRTARGAFNIIIADPVRFLRNLLGAVGQGVRQFMANILVHLRDGVIAWLAGPVARAGIQMPERWDLRGVIWFVLQILGLTWARVRGKLVRLMGERAVAMLEAGFQLIQEIRERGLVQALRDRVTEFFGNLREAALGAIRSFIQQRLVMAGIQQLLTMLTPVGAVVQAIIKIYNTVQFFIQRISQILELVESIVNSIAAIASGAIAAAADLVERTMARTIPVILDFLARFIGLGDVGAQVQRTIQSLQARVDQMLDRAVDWIRQQAARLATAARKAVRAVAQWWKAKADFKTESGQSHSIFVDGEPPATRIVVQSDRAYLEELVGQLTGNDKTEGEKLRKKIEKCVGELDRLGARGRIGAKEDEDRMDELGKELNQHLKDMGKLLADAGVLDKGVLALPRPTYDFTFEDNRATKAVVTNLSANRPMGSPPYQNPLGWDYLQDSDQTTGKAPYYRRLHLINHRLGGPGQRQNLVPGSQQNNSEMEKDYESPIKDLVGHEPLQPKYKAIVSMKVEVEYKRSQAIKSKKYSSRDFPSKILCTYEYQESKKDAKKSGTPVTLDVPKPD